MKTVNVKLTLDVTNADGSPAGSSVHTWPDVNPEFRTIVEAEGMKMLAAIAKAAADSKAKG